MGRRERTKPDMPYHPAPFVRALRACRDAMCDLGSQVKIGGPVYVAAHGITAAIDAMALLLTGDREYFWSVGGGASEAYREKMAERAARERGEKPWS